MYNCVHNKSLIHYALFFFYEKKGVQEGFLCREVVVFLIKIFNFYQKKNNFPTIDFFRI